MDSSRLRFLDASAFHSRPQDRSPGQRARSVSRAEMMPIPRQITDGPAISHPTYFLQSSFFPGGREMFFTSYRRGTPQVWKASLESGETQQITQGQAIHPFSPALHPGGEIIVT